MKIVVTGSIASDHLMRFPGRFADLLIPDQLDKVSLSFLVDDLVVRRGGVAPNIAVALARLGLRPVLLGAVGRDFDEYRRWLESCAVDCDSLLVCDNLHTARFVCTTDEDMCQIASFYAGAMSQAREIELAPVVDRLGGVDLVFVGPNDPEAMLRHTKECRESGYDFVADPSQQLARMSGADAAELVEGAKYLITNEYERGLLETKAGFSDADLLRLVGTRVTTLGADGVLIVDREHGEIRVPAAKLTQPADPTGVGDGFRGGFFAAISWGLPLERSAQVGAMVAAIVLESVGTQEYDLAPAEFCKRLAESYGDEAADEVRPYLPTVA